MMKGDLILFKIVVVLSKKVGKCLVLCNMFLFMIFAFSLLKISSFIINVSVYYTLLCIFKNIYKNKKKLAVYKKI